MSLKINLGVPEIILKMGNPSEKEVYEFDDFRLDAGHLMLYHKDEEVTIAPKAVETLLALVERRGKIVSKDELLEAVWPDAIVEESNLFVYLSVLRKTLGTQNNGKPWVETLRRRGYRFSVNVRLLSVQGNGTPVPVRSLSLARTNSENLPDDSPARPRDIVPPKTVWKFGTSVYVGAGIIAVALAVVFGYQYFFPKPPTKSIAVLPFASDSSEADGELVAEGMTFNLIGSLSKIPGLDVKANSTTSRYKNSGDDAATIGKKLNVQAVLASRIVQRGEDLTLYVELVDSETGNSLWQRPYPTKTSHLGILSGELMRDVVSELSIDVPDSTRQRMANDYSESAEATRFYLKGLVLTRRITEPQIREGLGYLGQATVHDPHYAPAFAAIGTGHRALTLCCDVPPSELDKAKIAAVRAVELDDNSAEAHSSLASVLFFRDWDFAEAEKHFLRALELDPNSATIHFQYGDFLGRMDKPDEAKARRDRAIELEPYSPFFNAFALSDPGTTVEMARSAIDLDPNFYYSHFTAAGVYRKNGMHAEALAAYRRARELSPEQTWTDLQFSLLLTEMGDTAQSRAILDEILRRSQSRYVPPFHIARVYNQLGDTEQALEWLERAYQVRDPKMTFLKTAVGFKKLESDPRFQDLKRRVGF